MAVSPFQRAPSSRSIALVVSSLGAGGAERNVVELAASWTARNIPVTVLTFEPPETDHYEVPDGVRRTAVEGGAREVGMGPVAALRRVARLRRALREGQFRAAIGFMTETACLLAAAGAGLPTRLYAADRVCPRRHLLPRRWALARRALFPRLDGLFAQTSSAARFYRERFPRLGVHVVPNGVSREALARRGAATGSSRTVVAAGRLDPQKGFDLLIPAFAQATRKFPDWSLKILGEGPERPRLERLVDAEGVGGRVTFPGTVRDPFRHLQEAAVFALSSRYEGFPNVLLEAMTLGLAVVAADCPCGPAEIVRDGVDGLLVDPDSVSALARGLERLMGDDDLRRRLGRQATDVADRFAPDAVATQWLEILDAGLQEIP